MNLPARATPVLMLLICVICWGSVFPISKVLLQSVSGLSLLMWRFLIALVCVCLYLLVQRKPWPTLSGSQYLVLAALGVLGVGSFNLALYEGLPYTEATNGALIMALSPLVTSIAAGALARRWLSVQQWISLTIGLIGVTLVITNGDVMSLLQHGLNRGDLLISIGMLCWAAFTIASQRVSHWLPPMSFTLVTMTAGWLAVSVYGLLFKEIHPWQEIQLLNPIEWLQLLHISLFGSVLAYLFWIQGVKAIGAANASLYFNLVPVSAALIALAMGVQLSLIQTLGITITIVGLSLPWLARSLWARRHQDGLPQ